MAASASWSSVCRWRRLPDNPGRHGLRTDSDPPDVDAGVPAMSEWPCMRSATPNDFPLKEAIGTPAF